MRQFALNVWLIATPPRRFTADMTEMMLKPEPAESRTALLPTPAVRPQADFVVYDGACGLCRQQMNNLNRWDRLGRLAFVSLHDQEVARRWPDLDRQRLLQELCVVAQDGRRYFGADAFKYLSTRLTALWPLALLLHIPLSMPLWRRMYVFLAKRRYRLSRRYACTDGSCDTSRDR